METRDFGLDTDASVRVHRCNKCPVWWGQAVYVWGQGVHGRSLYLFLNSAMNLKQL